MVTKEQKMLQEMMLSDPEMMVHKPNRRSNAPDLSHSEAVYVCEQLRKLGYIMEPQRAGANSWVAKCLDAPLLEELLRTRE